MEYAANIVLGVGAWALLAAVVTIGPALPSGKPRKWLRRHPRRARAAWLLAALAAVACFTAVALGQIGGITLGTVLLVGVVLSYRLRRAGKL